MPSAKLTLRQFDDSVFCLVNRRRAAHGRQQLRANPLLHRAALDYGGALMRGRFFSHYGDFAGHRNASNPVARLRQTGYIRPGYVWVVGEDLRWSTPETSSPGQVVEAWMESPIHRMYLLKPKFDELGVAGTRGTPIDPDPPDGITVAAEFGFRGSWSATCFPHLARSSGCRRGTCVAGEHPWLYFGFAVPDRTGGHIKYSAARSRYRLGPRGSLHP